MKLKNMKFADGHYKWLNKVRMALYIGCCVYNKSEAAQAGPEQTHGRSLFGSRGNSEALRMFFRSR